MKVKDVAARLEVAPGTVYLLIAQGLMPHYRVGTGRGHIRITEDQLQQYLDANERNKIRPAQPIAPAPPVAPLPKLNLKNFKLKS